MAQTIVARTTAIVVRDDTESNYRLHLVFDATTAPYLRAVLADAMAEFMGAPAEAQILPPILNNAL